MLKTPQKTQTKAFVLDIWNYIKNHRSLHCETYLATYLNIRQIRRKWCRHPKCSRAIFCQSPAVGKCVLPFQNEQKFGNVWLFLIVSLTKKGPCHNIVLLIQFRIWVLDLLFNSKEHTSKCVSMGAAFAQTRRSLGSLHPHILRLLVILALADFEPQSSLL